MVRPANETEQDEFKTRMTELTLGECAESPRFPTPEDTEISMLSSFSFHLPVKQSESPEERVDRIFSSLNENSIFKAKLAGFISEQLHSGR